jgi:broad specificity phosphatase PhoE
MKTYYIFRHGQTFATLKNKGYGRKILTAPILESGKPVIRQMGDFLKTVQTDLNLTSPVLRCRQTSHIITLETGKKFTVDWRLTEFMEPFPVLRWRINRLINQLEKSDFNNFLLCTHGAVIAGLVSFLTKGSFTASELLDYPPPGILIKIENGKIEEYDFNS